MPRVRPFRLKAAVPFLLLVTVLSAVMVLFLDDLVRQSVEMVGTEIVGARVDVDKADVRLGEGVVRLRGVQVTNPDRPMTNIVEAGQIVADLRVLPLLEKKIFLDTVAFRDVRFGTPREESGALDRPTETNLAIRRGLEEWRDRIQVPEFSIEALTRSIDLDAIQPDNLETPRAARRIMDRADSTFAAWETTLGEFDPGPLVDSARALVGALEGASLASLGVVGAAQAVESARTAIGAVTSARDSVRLMTSSLQRDLAQLDSSLSSLAVTQTEDLQRIRETLRLPNLDRPDFSAPVLGGFTLSQLQPVLHWLRVAERYLPPGLDPRRRPGPQRARASGTTVEFPASGALPGFTLAFGEASVEIGGSGGGAGVYAGMVRGLTTAPSVLGVPFAVSASRTSATRGPSDLSFAVALDHTDGIHDSIDVRVAGIALPSLTLAGIGGEVDLGVGSTELLLSRVGDDIDGRWIWRSSEVRWRRATRESGAAGALVQDVLWSALEGLGEVQIEVRFSGPVQGPRIAVGSNIGQAISRAVRSRLQSEVRRVEGRIRAEVDRLSARAVGEAQERVASVEAQFRGRLGDYEQSLEEVRAELETRIRRLTRPVP